MKYKIIEKIKDNNKIALFQHIKPDGDVIGATYSLCLVIKELFPEKEVVILSDWNFLEKHYPFLNLDKKYFTERIDDSYLAIVADTSLKERVIKYNQLLKAKEILCFDHHVNKSNIETSVFWHEPEYPSSSMQAYELIEEAMDIEHLGEEASLMLVYGILTDTGFFKYSLANVQAPKYFSKLLTNISQEKINNLYRAMNRVTKEDIEIRKYFYDHLEFDENIVYVKVPHAIIKKYPAITNKTIIDHISNINGCSIWVLILETRDIEGYPWKLSFRSNGPDVRSVGIKYGGSGHIRASGAKVKDIRGIRKVLKELKELK